MLTVVHHRPSDQADRWKRRLRALLPDSCGTGWSIICRKDLCLHVAAFGCWIVVRSSQLLMVAFEDGLDGRNGRGEIDWVTAFNISKILGWLLHYLALSKCRRQ